MKIYGERLSRAERVLWTLDECEIDYEHSPDPVSGEKSQQLLSINADGAIPTLDDNGFVITQSWAINLYLARRYGGGLASANPQEEAKILQWTFWAATDVENTIIESIHATGMLDPEQRNLELVAAHFSSLQRPLTALNAALENRDYLVGDRFTIGDLNAVSIVSWLVLLGFDFSNFRATQQWIQRCMQRPHFPVRG